MGKQWKQWQTLFSWTPKSLWMVTVAMKLSCLLLERKESWALKNWCFWTVEQFKTAVEKTVEKSLESPLGCKEIQPVHPKGNQSRGFIGRTGAEAEIPILWPPHAKSWLNGKDPDAGRDWGQEEKGTTEDESWMASLTQWTWVWVDSGSWWWTGRPGVLQSMGLQRVDRTEELNWTELLLGKKNLWQT